MNMIEQQNIQITKIQLIFIKLQQSIHNTKMTLVKNAYLLMAIFSILFQQTTQNYCLTNCTYDLDTNGAANYNGQCSNLDPSACTGCDSRFSFLAGTQCKLYPQGIYNTTFVIQAKDWQPMSATVPYLTGLIGSIGNDWRQFLDVATITYLKAMTVPYYGIRCRTLLHMSTVQFQPTLYFYVNTTIYGEGIEMRPVLDPHYNQQQWIYTSRFIATSDQSLFFRMVFAAPSPVNKLGGNTLGFRQTTCMVAYCVAGCASCTSLADCSACVTGYYLDVVHKHCNANMCPAGQYMVVDAATNNNERVCKLCDPLCDECSGSASSCSNCVDYGQYQSFLYQSECYVTCPSSFIPNEHNHTCDCPSGYYVSTGGICTLCNIACLNCTGGASSNCIACSQGYFLQAVATTTCSLTCPAGQYSTWVDDINKCHLCDTTVCVTCANSSSTCTSCNFATNNRWLFNYTCMYLCPDGYQANNVTFVCDQCMLGMYSYNSVCYSQCPLYYVADNAIRACVLPGGYPLNMTVEVENAYTLKFTIPLPLGLDPTVLAMLKTNWQSYISLVSITESKNILIFNQQRRLLESASKQLSISNAIIQNNTIILYSTSLNAQQFAHTHSFIARFKDNLFSPLNVIYSITSKNTTDSFPYVINEYFKQSMKPLYLVGIFLSVIALVVLLMKIKYIYRILIEYIHCIQLIGLTFFAIYPHSAQLNLYSFLLGFDYANFSFMYNIPQNLITPCYDCTCLISFSFAVGDMNWLRMMGALLLCAIIMFLFCLIIYVFKCSRKYAKFFVLLVVDLVLVKTVHGWFASLVYSGLNLTYNLQNFDMYILGVHLLSYLLLVPVIFARAKAQSQNKYVNISFIFLIIFIILMVLLSLGPTLICALLMLITVAEWGIVIGLGVKQQHPQLLQSKIQSSHFSGRYHTHLFRCMKPITAFLIACIVMIEDEIVPVALVSTIFGIFFVLIIIDAYFQYAYQDKFAKVTRLNNKSQSVNDTKQDFKQHDTEYKQNPGILIFDQNEFSNNNHDNLNEPDNDDIVGRKFRRNKPIVTSEKDRTSSMVKNVE